MALKTSQRHQDVAEACGASRPDRRERNNWYRMWYQRGTDTVGPPARYNKLMSHTDLLTSYLYAPESTQFSILPPVGQRRKWIDQCDVARDEFMSRWRDIGADVLFGELVTWALVYSSAWAKLSVDGQGEPILYYINPSDVGVLREDICQLDRQEAICHWYHLSLPELERRVRGLPHAEEIMKFGRQMSKPGRGDLQFPSIVQQVITTNITGQFPNQQVTGITNLGLLGDEHPNVQEELVELVEVWRKEEFPIDKGRHQCVDYEVTTLLGEYVIDGPKRNPVLPYIKGHPEYASENPFVAVIPKPMADYFWGRSNLMGLLQLQKWRELRMNQIDQVFELQLDPPRMGIGMNLTDEKANILRRPGGWASTPIPSGKLEVIRPQIPDDPYKLIEEIDKMFGDDAGIPEILQAVNTSGVRAGDQVSALANIAVGRIRKQALIIEDALEVLATRMFHIMQRNDAHTYETYKGQNFLLSQLPPDSVVKVDAHSASPVYADQRVQTASLLLKAKAIDLPTFVELLNPPRMPELREKARELQKQQAEMAQRMLAIQEAKAHKKG